MKYWKEILIGILTVVVVALAMSTTCTKQKLNVAENNVKALTDSVRVYKLSNDDLMFAKQAYILEKNELEKYLEISEKERKELEKKLKSSLAYIAKLEAEVRIDTLRLVDSVYIKDGHKNIAFRYNDKYVYLDGNTELLDSITANTTLNKLDMGVPLKVGLTEDNQLFITSSNPYVNISDIEGAQIVTKKTRDKRWGFGPYIGLGVGYGWVANTSGFNSGFCLGATLGVSIHYSIIQW